ncbi:hypothetical protein C8Q77DRAFT_1120582 [Trametes polyzona]|nr:hypothetical protein C8Q77DRAFT_1120582 [Trametes polyzona]
MLSTTSPGSVLDTRVENGGIAPLASATNVPGPALHGQKGTQNPPSSRPKTDESPSLWPPISRLDEDVFAIIASNLLQRRPNGSLAQLSLCCRRLRQLSMPLLFSRCTVFVGSMPPTPPAAIREYVRHLTYVWYWRRITDQFGAELPYLPGLQSVAFDSPADGVPWSAIKLCQSYANIKIILFNPSARFIHLAPYPQDVSSTVLTFEVLSYPSFLKIPLPGTFGVKPTTRNKLRALESACLYPLVLGMHETARSLTLPLETAPISGMADVDWPCLQTLELGGSAPSDADQVIPAYLPSMLRRMRSLRHFALKAALPRSTTHRYWILGSQSSPDLELRDLRTLVLSHPEPDDSIFSMRMPNLVHLSLRDWPRHYDYVALSYYHVDHRSPLLSATEMLSILNRLHVPELRTFELVYHADEADDDLLRLVVEAFPKLRHLEIHRYRQTRHSSVDYGHIARILSSVKSLATLRLHLDFEDDPGAYAYDNDVRAPEVWLPKLVERGWHILELLDACPVLESIALLFSASDPPSTWVWFHRSWLATRKPVHDFSPGNWDSLPRPIPKIRGRNVSL